MHDVLLSKKEIIQHYKKTRKKLFSLFFNENEHEWSFTYKYSEMHDHQKFLENLSRNRHEIGVINFTSNTFLSKQQHMQLILYTI